MNVVPVLNENYDIRLSQRCAYIVRRQDDQRVAALASGEAVTLGLMDGTRTLDELRGILVSALPSHGHRLLTAVTTRLRPLLNGIAPRRDYLPLSMLAQATDPDPAEGLRQFPGPRVLHWAVTQFCPRRCVYCFAEPVHGGRATDATITRSQLALIWNEAVSLGAENLLVAGAEPLLRDDLPEVLSDAVQAGLTILMTTKHPVSLELAKRFAVAGVPHISFSLDSMDPRENARLIGTAHYADQIQASVRNLARVGVAFSIQTVVTKLNPNSAHDVAAFAASEGAHVMQLVPFKPVRSPIAGLANVEMQLESEQPLDALVQVLQHRHPCLRVEKFIEPGDSGTGYHCDIGQTKLFFLPNGIVHRCYKLTDDGQLQGADLRAVSVAAAWHDPVFRVLISPPQSAYASSGCGGCAKFERCHEDGRCIFESLMRHGSYFGSDRFCDGPVTPSVKPIVSRV
jgi:pyrroloquinoline quinone biosynthesis protein E